MRLRRNMFFENRIKRIRQIGSMCSRSLKIVSKGSFMIFLVAPVMRGIR